MDQKVFSKSFSCLYLQRCRNYYPRFLYYMIAHLEWKIRWMKTIFKKWNSLKPFISISIASEAKEKTIKSKNFRFEIFDVFQKHQTKMSKTEEREKKVPPPIVIGSRCYLIYPFEVSYLMSISINILLTHFPYKCLFGSLSLVTCKKKKLSKLLSYVKFASKTLMRLTTSLLNLRSHSRI